MYRHGHGDGGWQTLQSHMKTILDLNKQLHFIIDSLLNNCDLAQLGGTTYGKGGTTYVPLIVSGR